MLPTNTTDTLFVINDTHYSRDDCQRAADRFLSLPELATPENTRIAVCFQDTFLWLALCLAWRERGGSVLPIHPGTPKSAARELALRTDCTHFLYGDSGQPEALPRPEGNTPRTVAAGGELIQLSSGTTGTPKPISRSWRDIDRELATYIRTFSAADELTPVIACPVTHSYGLICGFFAGLERGVVPRIVTNLNPRFILDQLRSHPRSLLYASPTLLSLLLRMLPDEQTLHRVMVSGASLPMPLLEQLKARSGGVFQQYGCSETGCIAIACHVAEAGMVGTPLEHLDVVAGESADKPAEICVSSGERMTRTRDLGYMDDHGCLHFIARMDDTINVAGINVYPADVENVVLQHPEIREAVAWKQPDAYAGERVFLTFVAGHEIDTEALRRWCRERLSPHQVPAAMEQVEEIPRLANGKISRRYLSERYGLSTHRHHKETPA
ncbi:MAG: AMP-binding protein [Marinobacter sp.]|uniref:AMP-binding protein n=1 Tax=Marinobacter sp. TaxID=50741 RepID=UPI003296BBFA